MKKSIIVLILILAIPALAACATSLRKAADVVSAIGDVAPAVLQDAADTAEKIEAGGPSLWDAVTDIFKSED